MKIAVLGAGAWGTAVAIHAAKQHEVSLWARQPEDAQAMQAERCNTRYLPGVPFPEKLAVASGTASASDVADQDLLILAAPVAGLRTQLERLLGSTVPLVWLCKGFEAVQPGAGFGLLPHEVKQQVAPELLAGVLSGPSFAQEVARSQPTALVVASPHALVCERAVQALHGGFMRVYRSDDLVGVEVGGAVKNVLAIATGVLDGLSQRAAQGAETFAPGLNARAALMTRGLAEMTRLGMRLGADAATFMGLSGMGDLVLTATGDLSRNRKVGLLLAQGMTADQAVDSLGHVAEGVYCARTVLARADSLGVDMPITRCVVALLDGAIAPTDAARMLLDRNAKSEHF
jgi:glycerol-3-phosphate dehydrogenase (NAD(P)+)